MNFKRLFLSLILLLLFSPVFSQEKHGLELSDSIYYSLKKNNFSPLSQSLTTSSDNFFPYNIYLKKINCADDKENLIIIFPQEDFSENYKEIIYPLLTHIFTTEYDFNIYVVFAYGVHQNIKTSAMIYGDEIFYESLNTNNNYTTFIYNLSEKENKIITTSNGYSSPAWLIKNEYNTAKKASLTFKLPLYYVSQLFKYDFNKDRQLGLFLSKNISSIKINFSQSEDKEHIRNFIIDSVKNCSLVKNPEFDQHFLLLNLFGRYFYISETIIISFIIALIFIFIVYLILLFRKTSLDNVEAWVLIKKVWFVFPVTFILILGSTFCANGISLLFRKYLTAAGNIYFLYSLKLIIAFLFSSIFYIFMDARNINLKEHSIDYFIVLTTFLNQFIFLFVDVSLFPIFMFTCILAIIAVHTKHNIIHFALFIFMILPYILYGNLLINTSDIFELNDFLSTNIKTNFALSFIFCPIFLMYFRILTWIENKSTSKIKLILFPLISNFVILSSCIFLGVFRTKNINNHYSQQNQISITKTENESIHFEYTDSQILNETIRTINIVLPENTVQCELILSSMDSTPVLYSDDSFYNPNNYTTYFLIPENPPEELKFSYGTDKKSSTITIRAYYALPKLNNYNLAEKTISIEN